jgi:hypothetical protein
MSKLIYAINTSLDGYVEDEVFVAKNAIFRRDRVHAATTSDWLRTSDAT